MASIQERKTQSGKKKYRVQVRLKGSPPQIATFDRRTDARLWAQQTEAAIREGRYFPSREAQRRTLADLINRYETDVLPYKRRVADDYRPHLHWWKGKLGHLLLSSITPSVIAKCRDELLVKQTPEDKPRSPSTANRYLATLGHAYSYAVREWEWVDRSPVQKVARLSEPAGRARFLSESEIATLLKACKLSKSEYLYPIVVLALSTGMRKNEILNLRWEDIDLKRGMIAIVDSKNGERRAVPLKSSAHIVMSELSRVRRIDTTLAFPGRRKPSGNVKPIAIRTAFETALEEAEIEDFRFHDLRHTAASYLAMNGATPSEIAHVLGHKTLAMVKRYAHLSDAHTSKVVERMNAKLFNK